MERPSPASTAKSLRRVVTSSKPRTHAPHLPVGKVAFVRVEAAKALSVNVLQAEVAFNARLKVTRERAKKTDETLFL